MKIEKAQPRRIKRSKPLSFRLTDEAKKQLEAIAKHTGKSMTSIIEELVADGYKDTLGGKGT